MFLLPFGLIAGADTDGGLLAWHITWLTIGNLIGGGVRVTQVMREAKSGIAISSRLLYARQNGARSR
jgi:hypothetical protein